MRPVDTWSLRPLAQADVDARSMLCGDGIEMGVVVPGCVLEAQYGEAGRTLLFVTHDIPFEERLDIVLLTASGVVADQASLCGAYTTGNFRNASSTAPDSVEFDFFGGHRWRARLLTRLFDRVRFPGREPIGVHRPFGWIRAFAVERAR